MSRPPNQQRAWAEIDLGCLERNLRAIRGSLPPHLAYIGVVKADAYGHGLPAVASRLMRCGADAFAVANLEEAAAILEIGSGWPVMVLSPLLPAECHQAVALRVICVVSSVDECLRLAEAARQQGTYAQVHLKVDTGMGRLGVWYRDAHPVFAAVQAIPQLQLTGLCTHFASADSNPQLTATQRRRFATFLAGVPPAVRRQMLIHADNSAGLESLPASEHYNGARVGLLQFGVRPQSAAQRALPPVEPVFSFHCRVGLVKNLPAGAGVSYGHTLTLKRRTRTAVLTAGYGDGIPTTLSNCGEVLIHGQRCPILGRVTMDQTIVDVSSLPGVAPGDVATIVGLQGDAALPITEFAARSAQIPWEAFCSITKRVPRFYRTDSAW
jgi:alanine racemase